MKVLLDSHVLVWALTGNPRLSARALDILADTENECWVSSASIWEITIKISLGKDQMNVSLDQLEAAIVEAGFRSLDISMQHALAVARIKTPHTDPFDRLLLAQCEIETLRLLTADRVLTQLPIAIAV